MSSILENVLRILERANTWSQNQTFSGDISAANITASGTLTVGGNAVNALPFDIYQQTLSGSAVTFTLTSTYKFLEFYLINMSSTSAGVMTMDFSDDGGSNWSTAVNLNLSSAGNFAGNGIISHAGTAATNKRIWTTCSTVATNYSSGSNGFANSAIETTRTGIINRLRFNTPNTFDNGDIVVRGWK